MRKLLALIFILGLAVFVNTSTVYAQEGSETTEVDSTADAASGDR